MEKVTIGFVPRERFSAAARSLQSLIDNTHMPYHLIVVDANTPERYRRQMMRILEKHPSVDVIRTDRYLLQNEAKNLVVQRNRSEFLALVENDNLFGAGWLTHLVHACEEQPAAVASPLLIEHGRVHFDPRLGSIRTVQTSEGEKVEFVGRSLESWAQDRFAERRLTQTVETHALLFRKIVFDKIGPFDEAVVTRREVDLIMALYRHGLPIVFEPKAVVEFLPPPPVHPDEREYFFMVWDLERARRSHQVIDQKWNLATLPTSMWFVERRHHMTSEMGFKAYEFGKRVRGKMAQVKRKLVGA